MGGADLMLNRLRLQSPDALRDQDRRIEEESNFKPGQSGNPGGRPKDIQGVTRLARKLCPKALHRLAEILDDPEAENSDKVRAAQVILDRGMGKVPEAPPDKPAPAYAFYRPLTPEQRAFAEHMVKTLPEGDEGPVGEPQGLNWRS